MNSRVRRCHVLPGLLAGLLLLSPGRVQAQWAVVDVSAIAQMVTEYTTQVQQYSEQIQQTLNQYTQIQQQVRQIEHAYTQVQQGLQNLQAFRLNNARDLLTLGDQLQHKLAQAQQIGYQTQQAVAQAQALYPRITAVLDGQQLRAYQQQWAGLTREAATVGISVQAIQTQAQEAMRRITDLMTRASQTQGNLEAQQAQVQAQGLIVTQLVSLEDQLATQARMQALQALREAALQEATTRVLEQSLGSIDVTRVPQGRLLSLTR